MQSAFMLGEQVSRLGMLQRNQTNLNKSSDAVRHPPTHVQWATEILSELSNGKTTFDHQSSQMWSNQDFGTNRFEAALRHQPGPNKVSGQRTSKSYPEINCFKTMIWD